MTQGERPYLANRTLARCPIWPSAFYARLRRQREVEPSLPVSIACSSIGLASEVPQASPRLTSSRIFSGPEKIKICRQKGLERCWKR
jgi:hypothetical protein